MLKSRRMDENTRKIIFKDVSDDASADIRFLVMVVLSCTVATYGLLSNSTAVVIGAMLISPIMGPILGGGLAIASNSNILLKKSIRAELIGLVVAVLLSAFLTIILPNATLTSEVMARTKPTILDLVVALASGAAGTYAMCFKPQGATLPGVAIATALMPPLCVVGIGLAQHNFDVMWGAGLLFLANIIAITVAATVVFEIAGFSRLDYLENVTISSTEKRKILKRFVYSLISLLIISIPLTLIMIDTYQMSKNEKIIKSSMKETLHAIDPHSEVVSANYAEEKKAFKVDATLRTNKVITPENIRYMENLLELKLKKAVKLNADVIFVQTVNSKGSIDSFKDILPVEVKKEYIEVFRTATPEEIIGRTLKEKIALVNQATLEDYAFMYKQSISAYQINVLVKGVKELPPNFEEAVKNLLEESLKRKVEIKIFFE